MIDRMIVNARQKIWNHFKTPPTTEDLLETLIDEIIIKFLDNMEILKKGYEAAIPEHAETFEGIDWDNRANRRHAIEILIPCAEKGDSFALTKLGEFIHEKLHVLDNKADDYKEKAEFFLKKAAACFLPAVVCNNRLALKNLGKIYHDQYRLHHQFEDLLRAIKKYRLFLLYDSTDETVNKEFDQLSNSLLNISPNVIFKSPSDQNSYIIVAYYQLSMSKHDLVLLGIALSYNASLISKLFTLDINEKINGEPNKYYNERVHSQALTVMNDFLSKDEACKQLIIKITSVALTVQCDSFNKKNMEENVTHLNINRINAPINRSTSSSKQDSIEEQSLSKSHHKKRRHPRTLSSARMFSKNESLPHNSSPKDDNGLTLLTKHKKGSSSNS